MSTAQVRTMREIAGLEQQEVASILGVSWRTYQRWESPNYTGRVPFDEIEEILLPIISTQQALIDEALQACDSDREAQAVVLTRYRHRGALIKKHPNFQGGLSAHNAAINAITRELLADGHSVQVVWDDQRDELKEL